MRNIFQQLYYKDLSRVYIGFKGRVIDNKIQDTPDIQAYLEKARKKISNNQKVLISYHNNTWEPVLVLASFLGLRKQAGLQNWLTKEDVENLLNLSGFEVISTENRFFGISTITIARAKAKTDRLNKKYSVSIVIPARNEEKNISKIIPSMPSFGKSQEFIFVEGHSKDNTWQEIEKERKKRYPKKIKVIALKQKGTGKADATWLGLKKARGQILMIYDADRTVSSNDLIKFYNVLSTGLGQFANGNRLLYPMHGDAMRTLNKLGNQIFGLLFTRILGQRFRDTLCGTKAFFKRDFKKFKRSKTDPFGDFDLIFGAIRSKLKVVEVPVKYKERVYGSTNINRFYHGLLLFKMVCLAYKEFYKRKSS